MAISHKQKAVIFMDNFIENGRLDVYVTDAGKCKQIAYSALKAQTL